MSQASHHDLVKGLNAEQSLAVLHDEGSLAVIAGAGSGKTRVLTHRVALLLRRHQVNASRILAVTFTNKAASEMKHRLAGLGIADVEKMWVGTFHGLCYKMLRRHHDAASLSPHFQILDAQEQDRLMKKLYKIHDWDSDEFDPKEAVRFINAQKDAGRRPKDCQPKLPDEKFFQQAYQVYQDACEQSNVVDFGELLLRCVELLRDHESIRLMYQEQFLHILVDEFQDTNDVQYNWVGLLSDRGSSVPVTVVGDMDQSIYSWRGAKMTNVERFIDEFSGVTMIKLEQNYRSTHHILNAANTLIQKNMRRIPKNLWTSSAEGEPVVLFEAYDEKDEADYAITQAIKQNKKTGSWKHTAILYRSNAQSRIIEEVCIKRSIPYKIYGGIRFFERTEIKDALAHLAVVVDLHNDLMMERALTSPSKGFGAKTLDVIRVEASQKKQSWAKTFTDPLVFSKLSSKVQKTWEMCLSQWQDPQHQTRHLDELIEWCVTNTGLLKHYQEIDRKEGTDRAANLQELISVGRRYTQGRRASGLLVAQEFLANAALEAEIADQKDHDDAVQLMTIHAAKGLEFPCVCAIGWDDGLFPSSQSIGDLDRLEEERRLAYVAITRAEQSLFITGATLRRQYGQTLSLPPSRFLSELPTASVAWARPPTRKGAPPAAAVVSAPTPLSGPRRQASYWIVGEKVVHPSFGEGTVVRVDGTAQNDRVMVVFDDGSRRQLLPQLAKLQKKA